MISWRPAVSAILVAAAVAGCITYFATATEPQRVETDRGLPPTFPHVTNIQRLGTEDGISAYQRSVEAILKRAQNAKASAGTDDPPITGRIPLPRRRPIPRL
jgi:hypothetical protein